MVQIPEAGRQPDLRFLSTSVLEGALQRRVRWAGTSNGYDEYIVGASKQVRVRVSGGVLYDLAGDPLSVVRLRDMTD